MFVIIMLVLICGVFVDWMKFLVMFVFMMFWLLIVYVLIVYMVWELIGWLLVDGVFDFVGGMVVYINVGIVGFVLCFVFGKCVGYGCELMVLYNLVLMMIGGLMLWVGWFGFNVGFVVVVDGCVGFVMLIM